MYSLKAVDELSNEKEYNVGTNTPNDFIRKTYLKIHVKGKYVYSYDIISKEDIPEKIRGQLEIAINKRANSYELALYSLFHLPLGEFFR